MAGETIETVITVDAKQAITELAKFDQETKAAEQALRDADAATKAFEKTQREAVAAVTAIDDRVNKYHRDLAALSDAVVKGAGNSAAYVEQMRRIEYELDAMEGKSRKVAVATEQVSKAMPIAARETGSAANKMLILGQFVDDAQYGLRGVVNNMPQVTQAFGGTMGLAGAVGIAAVAVSQLYDAYKAYDAIQKEVAANSTLWRDALKDTNNVLREGSLKSTNDLIQSLKDAQEEVRNFGKTAAQISVMTAQEALAAKEQSLSILEKNLPGLEQRAKPQGRKNLSFLQQLGVTEVFTDEEKEDFKAQNELLVIAKKRREELTEQVKKDKAAIDALKTAGEKLAALQRKKDAEDRARDRAKKDAEQEAKDDAEMRRKWVQQLYDDDDKLAKEAEKRRKEEEKQRGKDLQGAFALYDAEFKAAEKAEKARTKLAEKEAKKRAKIAEDERKEQIDSLTKTASAAAAAVGAFAAQSAMGQEAALSTLLSAAAQAAGGQIMLKGGEVIAGGIAGMLAAPNPASAAQIAGGLGLVAAGSAVQTGGPAAVSALLGMAGAGKSGSGAERSTGAADRGAAPRPSGGGGSGGPLVVNISYGVGGPLPEDTAREVARVMKTNDRRRGAA